MFGWAVGLGTLSLSSCHWSEHRLVYSHAQWISGNTDKVRKAPCAYARFPCANRAAETNKHWQEPHINFRVPRPLRGLSSSPRREGDGPTQRYLSNDLGSPLPYQWHHPLTTGKDSKV